MHGTYKDAETLYREKVNIMSEESEPTVESVATEEQVNEAPEFPQPIPAAPKTAPEIVRVAMPIAEVPKSDPNSGTASVPKYHNELSQMAHTVYKEAHVELNILKSDAEKLFAKHKDVKLVK